MNYYYHPILGLQYDYLGDLFLIDIDCIPESAYNVISKRTGKMINGQFVKDK